MAAQEMKLTLKLAGVPNLIKAIKQLDQVLNNLNRKFNNVAQAITNAANKITQGANVARGKGGKNSITPPPVMFGPNAQGQLNSQDLGSILFSAIQGNWRAMSAKVLSRLANMGLGNVAQKMGLGSGTQGVTALMSRFGKMALVVTAIITALIMMGKALIWFYDNINKAVQSVAKLAWATGGNNAVSSKLRGIGASAGMTPEQMAGMIHTPDMGEVLLRQLNILRNMDAKSAARYAQFAGIDADLARNVHNMSNADWAKANNSNNNSRTERWSTNAASDFSASVGQIKNSLLHLWEVLAPVLQYLAVNLRLVAAVVDAFATTLEWIRDGLISIIKWIANALNIHLKETQKDFKDGVDRFNDAVDNFTNKTGTFGGGNRTNNATPAAYTYYAYQDRLISLADSMGAFEY